jgi:hypothetical protein
VARQVTDTEGIGKVFCFTKHQIYKLVRRPLDPLPHRKIGKHLRFDVEKCWKWFDRQPGRDGEDLNEF